MRTADWNFIRLGGINDTVIGAARLEDSVILTTTCGAPVLSLQVVLTPDEARKVASALSNTATAAERNSNSDDLIPDCNCGRPTSERGCIGCSLHPLDCGCIPIDPDTYERQKRDSHELNTRLGNRMRKAQENDSSRIDKTA